MKTFKCPVCGSKLTIELYYHEIKNYVAKFEFDEEEQLDEPIDVGHEDDFDYCVLENIILECPNCGYEHTIEVGSTYDTTYAMFVNAEEIIGEELGKQK